MLGENRSRSEDNCFENTNITPLKCSVTVLWKLQVLHKYYFVLLVLRALLKMTLHLDDYFYFGVTVYAETLINMLMCQKSHCVFLNTVKWLMYSGLRSVGLTLPVVWCGGWNQRKSVVQNRAIVVAIDWEMGHREMHWTWGPVPGAGWIIAEVLRFPTM